MLQITIPEPCHEDWNKMTPDETGRHCAVCAKSVVDFTGMGDDEVKLFFLNKKKEERVCGRFKQMQLDRIVVELPPDIFSMPMPLWKKFLAACLVVFSTTLFSCETKIQGKSMVDEKTEQTTGMIAIPPAQIDTLPKPPADTTTNGFTAPGELKGDIVMMEVEPTPPVGIIAPDPVKDTTYQSFTAQPFIQGLPIIQVKPKNPPPADSIHCNAIKSYY